MLAVMLLNIWNEDLKLLNNYMVIFGLLIQVILIILLVYSRGIEVVIIRWYEKT